MSNADELREALWDAIAYCAVGSGANPQPLGVCHVDAEPIEN
jgi:hypothetical protein